MGISPNVWGPSTWAFIHLTAMAEPDNFDKSRAIFYKQLFVLLQELLPCERCRIHLKKNMSKLKDIEKVQSKRELFDWTTDIHNKVNEITNKPILSKDEAFNYWDSIANEKKSLNCKISWPTLALLLVLVLVSLIALILMVYRRKKSPQTPPHRQR